MPGDVYIMAEHISVNELSSRHEGEKCRDLLTPMTRIHAHNGLSIQDLETKYLWKWKYRISLYENKAITKTSKRKRLEKLVTSLASN